MCSSMITSVRTSAGLDDPPKPFTSNNNESLNHLLKQRADYERNEWPMLVSTNSFQICVNSNNMNVPRQSLVKENLSRLTSTKNSKNLTWKSPTSLSVDWNVSRATKTVVDKVNKITFGQKLHHQVQQ